MILVCYVLTRMACKCFLSFLFRLCHTGNRLTFLVNFLVFNYILVKNFFNFKIAVTLTLFLTGKNTDKAKFFRSDSKILGTAGIFIEDSNGGTKSLRSLHIAQVNPRRRYVFSLLKYTWIYVLIYGSRFLVISQEEVSWVAVYSNCVYISHI